MQAKQFATVAAMCLTAALAAWAQPLPMEPPHDSGQSVTGAFEGWFPNPDGTFSLLLGYYNRNVKEELDIPIGPNNRIEPGGPDYGQPTHFVTARMWGNFVIEVPKDFGDKQLTWTLVANGKTTAIPLNLKTDWEVSPFVDGIGNTPPYIGFAEAGPFVQGPVGQSATVSAALNSPLTLTVWVADDARVVLGMQRPKTPPITVGWTKFRGPGTVTFSNPRPAVEEQDLKARPSNAAVSGKATTTATFSEPGDYILRVVANDWTRDGGGGFQCCWTNAQVNVAVQPGPAAGR